MALVAGVPEICGGVLAGSVGSVIPEVAAAAAAGSRAVYPDCATSSSPRRMETKAGFQATSELGYRRFSPQMESRVTLLLRAPPPGCDSCRSTRTENGQSRRLGNRRSTTAAAAWRGRAKQLADDWEVAQEAPTTAT